MTDIARGRGGNFGHLFSPVPARTPLAPLDDGSGPPSRRGLTSLPTEMKTGDPCAAR